MSWSTYTGRISYNSAGSPSLNFGSNVRVESNTRTSKSSSFGQKIIASTLGKPIPVSRGKRPVIGDLLWATDVRQETKTKTTTYEFQGYGDPAEGTVLPEPTTVIDTVGLWVDLIIGFGAPLNPDAAPKIVQLRAGNTVLYDLGSGFVTGLAGASFAFYPGSETQMPDPVFESYVGVGRAPAYRGEIYCRISKLNLMAFGGVLPEFTAIIEDGATVSNSVVNLALGAVSNAGGADWLRNRVFWANNSGMVHAAEVRRGNYIGSIFTDAEFGALGNNLLPLPFIDRLVGHVGGGGNSEPLSMFDLSSGEFISTYGNVAQAEQMVGVPLKLDDGRYVYGILTSGILANARKFIVTEDGIWYYAGGKSIDYSVICQGPVEDRISYFYAAAGDIVYRIRVDALDMIPDIASFKDEVFFDFSDDAGYSISSVVAMYHWYATNSLILIVTVSSGVYRAIRLNSSGVVVWDKPIADPGWANPVRQSARVELGFVKWAHGATARIYNLDLFTGNVSEEGILTGVNVTSAGYIYDCYTDTFYGVGGSYFRRSTLSGSAGDRIEISTLLLELAEFVGYDNVTVDADITGEIDGFLIEESYTDFWRITTTIGEAYMFAPIESGEGIHFRRTVKLGEDADTVDDTLTLDDLATLSPMETISDLGSDPFSNAAIITTRKPDYDVIEGIEITYRDYDYDYAENMYPVGRARLPSETYISGNTKQINIPQIITRAADIAELAASILWDDVASRTEHQFRLKTKKLRSQPGDTFEIDDVNGIGYRFRLDTVIYHRDFSLTCVASDYLSSLELIPRDSDIPTPPNVVYPPDNTSQVVVFDVPLLKAEEYTIEYITVYYGIAGLGQDHWRQAGLYRSEDGTNYEFYEARTDELIIGKMVSELPAPADLHGIDDENSIVVYMENGDIDSWPGTVEENSWLAGLNVAVIGAPGRWETIWFRDVAVDEDQRRLTLSGLLRGQRDTYPSAGLHVLGDRVVFPYAGADEIGADSVVEPISDQSLTRYYKAVGDDADDLRIKATVELTAEAQRPWSVVGYRLTRDGSNNLTLKWARQSRLQPTMNTNGAQTFIEDGAPREYRVEIKDGPGGAIVRTELISNAETYVYSSANQTSDGLVPPLYELTFQVTQIDDTFGDGRTVERTVPYV